jgi:hypothetical protein
MRKPKAARKNSSERSFRKEGWEREGDKKGKLEARSWSAAGGVSAKP